jgi:glycerol-3-phosphate dehydrogenase (NAD(P)+)
LRKITLALALVSLRAGNRTTLYVRDEETCRVLREERRHLRSLRGVTIPEALFVSTHVEAVLSRADAVILAIPTQKLPEGLVPLRDLLLGKIIVSAAKGIEIGTLLRPTRIVEEVLADDASPVCALSGPNLSSEVAAGKPATTVVASRDTEAATTWIQGALMGTAFRIYTSTDIVGVEMGGSLKNIIAIGAGIGDGLGEGDNAKAAFLTRGIAEIARLGIAHGAQPLTFAGLSGIGDLIATCSSPQFRNHQVGAGLATGASLEDVLGGMSEVAEGVSTTRAAVELAHRAGVEMPITEQMYKVLFEAKSAADAVGDLMVREPKEELHGRIETV